MDQAIGDYTDAIRLFPRYCTALRNRSMAYRSKGLVEQALADLEAVVCIDPKDETALFLRGDIHLKSDRAFQAIDEFTKVVGTESTA